MHVSWTKLAAAPLTLRFILIRVNLLRDEIFDKVNSVGFRD